MKTGIALVIFSLAVAVASELPSYIKVCNKRDPPKVLGECITKSVYTLLPLLKTGIPELDIPSLEPFKVNAVSLNTGNNAARVLANLTDIVVYNASTFKILEVLPDVARNYFRFKVVVPHLYALTNYEIDSKVLLLTIRGSGIAHLNITDYYFDCSLKGDVIEENGGKHLLFEKMKCDISYKTGSIYLENLFNGDPVLGDATNGIINDNLGDFYAAMKPNIVEALTNLFTDISNKITRKFDYDDLFP